MDYLIYALVAVAAFLVGAVVDSVYRKNVSEKKLGSAEEEAKRILNDAIKNAENKQREAMVEAKEAILTARNEWEKEEKERRSDIQKQENRLQQKEENLDKKLENLEKKEEALQDKLSELGQEKEGAEALKDKQVAE